jgi:hypothetical protein
MPKVEWSQELQLTHLVSHAWVKRITHPNPQQQHETREDYTSDVRLVLLEDSPQP